MNLNDKVKQYKCLRTSPPTYLSEFDVDSEEILLYYVEGDTEDTLLQRIDDLKVEQSSTDLDLTGSPLHVDLKGDESFGSCSKVRVYYPWSDAESKQYPMCISQARKVMNECMRMKNIEGDDSTPVYIVCDGNNAGIVLLGAQKAKNYLMTALVKIIGCCLKEDEQISLKSMEENHLLNCRVQNCVINYLVKFRYYLYGTFLQNRYTEDSEYFGSICIEITCTNKCFLEFHENPSTKKKLILQIIAGHNKSPVYFLWGELCTLQSYLDILSIPDLSNNPDTVISVTPLNQDDIQNNIRNILQLTQPKVQNKSTFDLKNIRNEYFMDKLWNLLKQCADLSSLRDSFHFLFEELVERNIVIYIPSPEDSNIGAVITGLCEGKLAVPTVSFPQALEFLFELGIEKMKNDYQNIIKQFCLSSYTAISNKWSKMKRKTVMQGAMRKTRVTVNLKAGTIDQEHNVSKMAYLGKLHVATELIYLVKNESFLPDEIFKYFCGRVCRNYVDFDGAKYNFTDIQDQPVCEFNIEIDTRDKNVVKKETPVSWSMRMTSEINNVEVTTLYHLSKHQIFPSSIYDKYDITNLAEEDEMLYYVSKLEMHKEYL